MPGNWDVLVASADIDHRRSLEQVFATLSLNVISCSALKQAAEVLSRQTVNLVFCDDALTDGSYRDLLTNTLAGRKIPRLVVTMRMGEWEEYLDAMRSGAFDALRRPCHPTDVEMVVLRAIHEDRRAAYQVLV
jgi:DNA-binding NtrC family response regulator